jgi:hypothetical protein
MVDPNEIGDGVVDVDPPLVAVPATPNVQPVAALTIPVLDVMLPCLYQTSAGPVVPDAAENTEAAPVIKTGEVLVTSKAVAPPPPLFAVLGGIVLTVDCAMPDQKAEHAKTKEYTYFMLFIQK